MIDKLDGLVIGDECIAPQEYIDKNGCEGYLINHECGGCYYCPDIDFSCISSKPTCYAMYFDEDRFF